MINMEVWRRKMRDAAFETRLARLGRKVRMLRVLHEKAVAVGLKKTADEISGRISLIKWGWMRGEWIGRGKTARFKYEN